GAPTPVVHELVARHPDEPWDGDLRRSRTSGRRDRGQERLGGEVLGGDPVAAPVDEVAVDDRKGAVVQREQGLSGRVAVPHAGIVVRGARAPTGPAEFSGSPRVSVGE